MTATEAEIAEALARVKEAEAVERAAGEALNAARKATAAAEAALVLVRYGIGPGVLVRDKRGKVFRVTRIKTWFRLGPDVYGVMRLKDGSFGDAEHRAYSPCTVIEP